MNTNEILKFLEKEIHSVIMATVDDNGLPITCAIDIMDSNESGLYFLTAKGKGFYDRLKKRGYAALTERPSVAHHGAQYLPRERAYELPLAGVARRGKAVQFAQYGGIAFEMCIRDRCCSHPRRSVKSSPCRPVRISVCRPWP